MPLNHSLSHRFRTMGRIGAGLLLGAVAVPCVAAEEEPQAVAWKFTPTLIRADDGNRALDFNLRASRGPHYAWIARYGDSQGAIQYRTGYEYRIEQELYRVVLSPQWAGGGYLGASVSSEIGPRTFAIAGWGRTNLRSAYNLLFDPNDALTVGAGTRAIQDTELFLFQIRDDRLHTGQRNTHAIARFHLSEGQRLSLDLLTKSGLASNGQFISGRGLSVTWDHRDQFIRLAVDPYANFSAVRQVRLAAGLRFQ
jgi:hypothetical protein